MRKLYSLLLPALLLVSLIGCEKKPQSLADLKDGTPADSMMFYFGQMQASNFWQDAASDTLLRSIEARKEFLKGFNAALKMENEKAASPYNKGLQLGLRLAIRLREFQERYGMEFSESIMSAALEQAILKDSCDIDIAEAQKGFYLIKDRLELIAANKDVADAKGNLASEAKRMGFTMITDTLYAKDITPAGNGPTLKEGARVAVEVTASTIDGTEIVAKQFPDSLTIGEGRVPNIVSVGMRTMTSGQTRTFMTTPRTLFGKRYAIYHLPSDQPVIFTVKAIEN